MKGVRPTISKLASLFPFDQFLCYFSNGMCLFIIGTNQPTSEDSSEDELWVANEDGTYPGDEDDTYQVMKDFATISSNEGQTEFSDLYNNFNSLSVRNSYDRPKK